MRRLALAGAVTLALVAAPAVAFAQENPVESQACVDAQSAVDDFNLDVEIADALALADEQDGIAADRKVAADAADTAATDQQAIADANSDATTQAGRDLRDNARAAVAVELDLRDAARADVAAALAARDDARAQADGGLRVNLDALISTRDTACADSDPVLCDDFNTQTDAQAAFEAGATELDADGDGLACDLLLDDSEPVLDPDVDAPGDQVSRVPRGAAATGDGTLARG